jgi:hypothetical protein
LLSLRWLESIVFRGGKKGETRERVGSGKEKKGEKKQKEKKEETRKKAREEGSGRLVVAAAPRAFHPRATESGIGSMPDHVAKRAKNVPP